jgi:hypothetical protein
MNSKMAMKNFSHERLPCASVYKQEVPKVWKPYTYKMFMTIFEFFLQNNVFKLKEDFSEHGIRVFLENGLRSFQTFLILQITDKSEVLKRFQKLF